VRPSIPAGGIYSTPPKPLYLFAECVGVPADPGLDGLSAAPRDPRADRVTSEASVTSAAAESLRMAAQ